MTIASLENFSSRPSREGGNDSSHALLEGSGAWLPPRASEGDNNPGPRAAAREQGGMPQGVDASSWSAIQGLLQQGGSVRFTTAEENAASGTVPDYIMRDGQLMPNPAKPPGSPMSDNPTVQVENGGGQEASREAARQLQVAAVQEQISYWQQAHPGQEVPEFLKGQLHTAQQGAGYVRPDDDAFNRLRMPQIERASEQPTGGDQIPPAGADSSPGGSRGGSPGGSPGGSRGGSPGGSRGGSPGGSFSGPDGASIPSGHQSVGGAPDIGEAPSRGSRDGSFDSSMAPIDRSAIPAPVAGDINIKGPPSCNVEQIQQFLERMGSPAAREQGFSQALYDATTQRGIDPAVALGFFLQESTCGRYGRGARNHSLGNIRGTAPESGGSDGGFRSYRTWAEGARDWARLIDETYDKKWGLRTLSQVIHTYAPNGDGGNNESRYASAVNGVVQSFRRQNAASAPETDSDAPRSARTASRTPDAEPETRRTRTA